MRLGFIFVLFFLAFPAFAVNETIGATPGIHCAVELKAGLGKFKLIGPFNGATVELQTRREDEATFDVLETYTSAPSINPQTLDFGSKTYVQFVSTGNTGTTSIYCEVNGPKNRL